MSSFKLFSFIDHIDFLCTKYFQFHCQPLHKGFNKINNKNLIFYTLDLSIRCLYYGLQKLRLVSVQRKFYKYIDIHDVISSLIHSLIDFHVLLSMLHLVLRYNQTNFNIFFVEMQELILCEFTNSCYNSNQFMLN